MKDQALRQISEQVATTRAELGFPGMAKKTPFPAYFQVSHQASTRLTLVTPLWQHPSSLKPLMLCRPQSVSQYHPRHKLSPHLYAALTLEIDGEHVLRAWGGGGGGQRSPPLPRTCAAFKGSVAASVLREKSDPKPACPLQVWC